MADTAGSKKIDIDIAMSLKYGDAVSKTKALGQAINEAAENASGTRTVFLYMAFGLMAAGGMLSRIGQSFGNIAHRMATAYSEVEYQAAIVGTVLGATASQTERVADKMLELSMKTGFSAKQVGEAMQGLAMAGFTYNGVMGATPAILDMARVGMMDVGDAVNLAVGIFNGFDMQARSTNDVMQTFALIADELVYAANESVVSVQGLAEAFKFVSASAALAGWSVEETLAVLMVAGDNMIRSGIAGRNLRISLQKLQQIAASASGEMATHAEIVEEYGKAFLDADNHLKGVADIVEVLQTKMAGLTEVQRNSTLAQIFGTEALTLWSALYKKNVNDIRENELALTAVGAKAALYNQFGGDATNILVQWRKELKGQTYGLEDLKQKLISFNISADAANNIVTVLTDTSKNWEETIRSASSATLIAEERLTTLKGSTDVLKATWDTLYASYGKTLAPLLEDWNKILVQIIKVIDKLPDPLKQVVAIFSLTIYTVFTLTGKLLTFAGTLMLVAAAQMVVNQQQDEINLKMNTNVGYTNLLIKGWRTVAGSMTAAAAAAWALTKSLVKLAVAAGMVLFLWTDSIRQWREGNKVLAAVEIALTALTVIMYLYSERARIMSFWTGVLKLKNWILAKSTDVLTASTWRANFALKATRVAMAALPIMAMITIFMMLKDSVGWVSAALLAMIPVWIYLNTVMWMNPVLAIVGAIGLAIGAIAMFQSATDDAASAYESSGSQSPFFHDIQLDAEAASLAVSGLGNTLVDFHQGYKGKFDMRTSFINASEARGNRVFAPSVSVNISGTQVNGNMNEERLGRVVSKATRETIRQLNSDFERSSE